MDEDDQANDHQGNYDEDSYEEYLNDDKEYTELQEDSEYDLAN